MNKEKYKTFIIEIEKKKDKYGFFYNWRIRNPILKVKDNTIKEGLAFVDNKKMALEIAKETINNLKYE